MDDDNNGDLVALGQQSPHLRHQEFFKAAFTENSSYRLTKQSIYTKLQSLLNSRGFYQITRGKNTIDLETATNE